MVKLSGRILKYHSLPVSYPSSLDVQKEIKEIILTTNDDLFRRSLMTECTAQLTPGHILCFVDLDSVGCRLELHTGRSQQVALNINLIIR